MKKGNQEFVHSNPRMRIYISRQEQHKKVKAVIQKHLEAMADDLAVTLADTLEPGTEFAETLERFIDLKASGKGSDQKTKVEICKQVVVVSKPTFPETYNGFVDSTVRLEGKKEGCFPFDIRLQLMPFDHKRRALDELWLWYNNIENSHCTDPDEVEADEETLDEISDMLGWIAIDLKALEEEQDEDEFWESAHNIEFNLQEADDLLAEINSDWANQKGLMKFY